MAKTNGTTVLCILDGWGYSETEECNAILAANTPIWDELWKKQARTLISTHGSHVGLPDGQMGNSEVGHINIGAGRVVYQDVSRIDLSIDEGSFFNNSALTQPVDHAIANNKQIHIMGLLSDGGVHSKLLHIKAMVKLAIDRGANVINVHVFLDGRDTAPKSANKYLTDLDKFCRETGKAKITSMIGRYFALDRDNRWDRIEKAYDLIIKGEAEYNSLTVTQALEASYERDESDEFVSATVIGEPVSTNDGDVMFFMNFRSDRARELTESIVLDNFSGFERESAPKIHSFTTLTEYKKGYPVSVAFPTSKVKNSFGEYISSLGCSQLRIAETEKYAHVTFFFNGGEEEPFEREHRIMVKSPNVATYDLQPEMSAVEVADKLVTAINDNKYDAIICNFANSDMVGHTGNLAAAIKAIETLDAQLGKLIPAIQATGSNILITADHGNSEQMCDYKTGGKFTSHTTNLVPLIYVGTADCELSSGGCLADLAPTLLDLMNIEIPSEMTGISLLKRNS